MKFSKKGWIASRKIQRLLYQKRQGYISRAKWSIGPYKTYLMSVTIFWLIFLIPHLLSEHKQLMIHVHPLSPIRYLQPSLNLLLWLASSIFWNRKYWRIIIIPNNSIHARVCWIAELLEGGPRPLLGADFQCSLASHGRYTEVTEASGGGSKGAASPGPNSRIDGY